MCVPIFLEGLWEFKATEGVRAQSSLQTTLTVDGKMPVLGSPCHRQHSCLKSWTSSFGQRLLRCPQAKQRRSQRRMVTRHLDLGDLERLPSSQNLRCSTASLFGLRLRLATQEACVDWKKRRASSSFPVHNVSCQKSFRKLRTLKLDCRVRWRPSLAFMFLLFFLQSNWTLPRSAKCTWTVQHLHWCFPLHLGLSILCKC